jgi:hypothetical protein
MTGAKPKFNNYSFDEVVRGANEKIAQGMDVYQKFTCSGCGSRLTMEEPNVFSESGACDKCPAITDIKKDGCNYLVITRIPR